MISVHYMAAYITYPIRLKAEQFQSKQLSHAMSRYNGIIRVAYIVGNNNFCVPCILWFACMIIVIGEGILSLIKPDPLSL